MDTIKLKLIYPKWNKLPGQTTFNLPPHGPVAFAATLPEYIDISFLVEINGFHVFVGERNLDIVGQSSGKGHGTVGRQVEGRLAR